MKRTIEIKTACNIMYKTMGDYVFSANSFPVGG